MHDSIIVSDGFYQNPDDVRAFSLSQDFSIKGNYPGTRTQPFLHQGIFDTIQSIVKIPITYWPNDSYNGAFQFSLENDHTWVHADHTTVWSGVVYLTPNAPLQAGTAFFRHTETGLEVYPSEAALRKQCDQDASRRERWLTTDQVANKFNRLVLFRGKHFHCSQNHFGNTKETGRLFQTFFFNTAY